MRYLPVPKENIPVRMLVIVDGVQYEFSFFYNKTGDFFTVTLAREGQDIITGEKVVLDKPLFTIIDPPFDETYFIPLDVSDLLDRISYDNWGTGVRIYTFQRVD